MVVVLFRFTVIITAHEHVVTTDHQQGSNAPVCHNQMSFNTSLCSRMPPQITTYFPNKLDAWKPLAHRVAVSIAGELLE